MKPIKDLDLLTAAMAAEGFTLIHSESFSMDSGRAEFSNGKAKIGVLKDKSQWMFDGSQEEFEALGLWKAFNDISEFRSVLREYAAKQKA